MYLCDFAVSVHTHINCINRLDKCSVVIQFNEVVYLKAVNRKLERYVFLAEKTGVAQEKRQPQQELKTPCTTTQSSFGLAVPMAMPQKSSTTTNIHRNNGYDIRFTIYKLHYII